MHVLLAAPREMSVLLQESAIDRLSLLDSVPASQWPQGILHACRENVHTWLWYYLAIVEAQTCNPSQPLVHPYIRIS
jgi:hypothetical protein